MHPLMRTLASTKTLGSLPSPHRWARSLSLGVLMLALPAQAADDRFAVKVSGQSLQVNQAQKVKIKLTADNPWHMNMDFPTSMKLQGGAGLELSKTKFKKGDAAVLSEHKIVFEVPVKATRAGRFEAEATIKFAICKADSCSPARTKVKLLLNAKAEAKPAAEPKLSPKPKPKAAPKARPKARPSARPKTQAKSSAKALCGSLPLGKSLGRSKKVGLFDAAAQCPSLSIYLVEHWMLDPVWGAGLVERVITHLGQTPNTP